MRIALLPVLLAGAAVAGCHTAQPADQSFHHVTTVVPEAPSVLAARIAGDAAAEGYLVSRDGPLGVTVDFGEQIMRVPVPTDYGLWGTRVSFRDTRVRSSAGYRIAPGPNGGSRVTMTNNPIYWHPDIKVWLPGPYDVAPGVAMLDGTAGEAPIVE